MQCLRYVRVDVSKEPRRLNDESEGIAGERHDNRFRGNGKVQSPVAWQRHRPRDQPQTSQLTKYYIIELLC